MIDSISEDVVSLTNAAKLLPARRNGKKPHTSCIYRWTQIGCKGVILESIQVGGTRCTSKQALSRFFQRLSGNDSTIVANLPAPPALLSDRSAAIQDAEMRLKAAGC